MPRKPAPVRRKSTPDLRARTPLAEWIAAACGLALTLSAIGVTVWQGLSDRHAPPALRVAAEAAVSTGQGWVVPVVISNAADATAADVEITGVLSSGGSVDEVRRARFTYVPGRGEARGGLVFHRDPTASDLRVAVEGYALP